MYEKNTDPLVLHESLIETDVDKSLGNVALSTNVEFAWLEITGKCQFKCIHCYANSGPKEEHGPLTDDQWKQSIDQVRGLGGKMVQFIGGEPLLHPSLPSLIEHARNKDLKVEVYSNLSFVSDSMWSTLSQEGVSLATSYYSPDATEHDSVTQNRGSHKRTRANIVEAIDRGIPIRAGVIGVLEGQQVEAAQQELVDLGVQHIGVDYLRQVGRGTRTLEQSVDELCGNCGHGVIAILGNGAVQPCVFSRWGEFTIGNVQEKSLAEILASPQAHKVQKELDDAFDNSPTACRPNCEPNCSPSAGEPCAPECPPRGLTSLIAADLLARR